MRDAPTFLNLDLEAPDVRRLLESVTIEQERIALSLVQGDASSIGGELDLTSALGGAAGIGAAANGDVYLADTDGNRVLRVPACAGEAEPVGCLETELEAPRGVLVGPRESLYVADTGHHRILVVDLATEQLRAVWGQRDHHGEPVAGSEAGELDSPWDLAADASERLYVVDHGNRRIQRFDVDGHVDPGFATALAADGPSQPEYVATAAIDDEERLIVFDRLLGGRSRLLVYELDGTPDAATTEMLRELLRTSAAILPASPPAGLAASGSILYVAESVTGRVLQFDLEGRFQGFARWHGPAAGLALDAQGRLLVHPGTGTPSVLATERTAAMGAFRIGPFFVSDRPTAWQTLHARLQALPEGAHFRLFALTTENANLDPPALDDPSWQAAPVDSAAWLTGATPNRFIWIGGRLTSGPGGGPVLRGLRLDFDREGLLRYLPAIYARESSPFLEPALALLEDGLVEQEDHIDSLPRYFDPQAAPASALPWLAGWLAWELEETLEERRQRALLDRAFELQGRRGTAWSLRELVRLVLEADAAVSEPSANLRVWRLGEETGLLGWGSMLTAAEPDGAIVGTTAELDRSHLQRADDFGSPLFEATAQRFCVRVYGADLAAAGARQALERLVERERPAGTDAHLCILEPRLRVGFQATVGIDAIVGRGPEHLRLGATGALGAGAALAGARSPGTVGAVRVSRLRNSSKRGAT